MDQWTLETGLVISGPMEGLDIGFMERGQHSKVLTDIATTSQSKKEQKNKIMNQKLSRIFLTI